MDNTTPKRAGQYYLLDKVAQGGMAEIFKGLAYDTAGIKKTVCIKKILPNISANPEFIDMLIDEAKIAVQLNHGNIAQIYDLGKAGEDYFIVMEYVEGQNLSKINRKMLRRKQTIPTPLACYIIAEVASGLSYMHRKTDEMGDLLNIIHRDISPQNIMVSYSGTVKIIDFGIAKAAFKSGHTESGTLKGKFAYMSPEQADGDPIDHRSDIFALGVIFHEIITGKRLFKGEDNQETIRNVRRAKVPLPSSINPGLPKAINDIALKVLAKDRNKRYATASDFRDDLMKFLYTHFPEFRPSQLIDYVAEVFQSEMAEQRSHGEAEPETPHLILDQTRSAMNADKEEVTSGGNPVNWREFMLELDWPEEEADLEEEDDADEESESEGTHIKWSWDRFKKTPFLLGLAAALLTVGLFRFFQHHATFQDIKTETAAPIITTASEILKPAAAMIESTPAGAKIFLNDVDSGKTTPATLEKLDPGRQYSVGLFLQGYQFVQKKFTAAAGEKLSFSIQMSPNFGGVKILSDPPGAQVTVDGNVVGATPFEQNDLKPDTLLHITVELEGFAPWKQEVLIRPGNEQTVSAKLQRKENHESK